MNGIETILWDIGGVILSNGWERDQRERVLLPLGVDTYPASFDILLALKRSGQYKLPTLNHASIQLNEYRLDNFGLRPLFDYFICSGHVNEMKPHPDIFRIAVLISGHQLQTPSYRQAKEHRRRKASRHARRPL